MLVQSVLDRLAQGQWREERKSNELLHISISLTNIL